MSDFKRAQQKALFERTRVTLGRMQSRWDCKQAKLRLQQQGESFYSTTEAAPESARGGTRTRTALPPRDFKSLVSTYSTTQA